MNNYLLEVRRLIEENRKTADSILVINQDGIIEYSENCNDSNWKVLMLYNKMVSGKSVFEIYKDIFSESESSIMIALKTGENVSFNNQLLKMEGFTFKLTGTSYPVLDENGNVKCVVDVSKVLECGNTYDEQYDNEVETVLATIITKNARLMKIKSSLPAIARNESSVFIYGETGTGKELIAEAIHNLSERKNKPFISQNCAAIPEGLMESIFFGTEKGGFTGAENKKGLFELADGGTLFLDEINSMNTSMQSKLLKVLEEHQLRKVGGQEDIKFDVRIICASNEHPADLIKESRMRMDFYYRIGVEYIELPPLRERKEDLLLLTRHFIELYNEKTGRNIEGLSSMAEDLIMSWQWPGNVRELKGLVESAFNQESSNIITLNSIISIMDRIMENRDGTRSYAHQKTVENSTVNLSFIEHELDSGEVDLARLLDDYEREVIRMAMKKCDTLSSTAKKLSMSPQKLNYRISKLNI